MTYRVTCLICHESAGLESPTARGQWAVKHTNETQHAPLWDVQDLEV